MRELSIFMRRGGRVFMEDQKFFGYAEGGGIFYWFKGTLVCKNIKYCTYCGLPTNMGYNMYPMLVCKVVRV